jgi:UTP--glucose-1-phosphate uridylyltransferase
MDKSREFGGTPVVKLGDQFKKVAVSNLIRARLIYRAYDGPGSTLMPFADTAQNFEKRFKSIPNITELDHLTVSGDVSFGKGVRLAGTCIIVANEGSKIMIPDGTSLENKLITGNLNIIDH